MGTARIAVGVDGSEGSHHALEWAVEEATKWGACLTVVHAWRFGRSPTDPDAAEAVREIGRAAQDVVDHEVAFARAASADASGVLVFKGPVSALVDAAGAADLLVVGSRGRGAVAASVLGSVSQGCVRHARCPIVVVPGSERDDSSDEKPLAVALDR
jgi:nucleotide-binding universal stress UspA family protein